MLITNSTLDSSNRPGSPRCVPTHQVICQFQHEVASPGTFDLPQLNLTSLHLPPADFLGSPFTSILGILLYLSLLLFPTSLAYRYHWVQHVFQKLLEKGYKSCNYKTVFRPCSPCAAGLAGHGALGGNRLPAEFGTRVFPVTSHPVLVLRSLKPL